MKGFLQAGKAVFLDLASTLLFLVLYLVTKSLIVSVVAGMAVGVGQIGWEVVKRRPIGTIQYLSLIIVLASSMAALFTHDIRFIMLKPSVFYAVAGAVMLKPGWMIRYLPPEAMEIVPDIGEIFGFVWAGLMLLSAAVNIFVALSCGVAVWASVMTIYAVASKLGLFVIQYATMRVIGVRRRARLGTAAA